MGVIRVPQCVNLCLFIHVYFIRGVNHFKVPAGLLSFWRINKLF